MDELGPLRVSPGAASASVVLLESVWVGQLMRCWGRRELKCASASSSADRTNESAKVAFSAPSSPHHSFKLFLPKYPIAIRREKGTSAPQRRSELDHRHQPRPQIRATSRRPATCKLSLRRLRSAPPALAHAPLMQASSTPSALSSVSDSMSSAFQASGNRGQDARGEVTAPTSAAPSEEPQAVPGPSNGIMASENGQALLRHIYNVSDSGLAAHANVFFDGSRGALTPLLSAHRTDWLPQVSDGGENEASP